MRFDLLQVRGDARQPEGRRVEELLTQRCHELLAPDLFGEDGGDNMSVVDGNLKVYGLEKLRIADGSIMPRITTSNTMAPCVVIGERAAEILKAAHAL